MNLSPIVIFAYNRPVYLRQTLEALENNAEAKDSILYIYCDGPKPGITDAELNDIAEVRAIAREKEWCKVVNIIEREKNYGLSQAIINGVTEIFEKHDRVIVLEDDLVTSPQFLNFMNTALTTYEQVDDVISVVGYNYPINYESDYPETFFLKSADCLGWGTWKRGWDLYERDANVLIEKLEKLNAVSEFNFDDQYPYIKLLRNVAKGTANSWAIRWYATAFVNNKLTLFPQKSFVRHIGNMGTNVKADNSDIYGWDISTMPVNYFEARIEEDKIARNKLSKHFRKYNRRRMSVSTLKYIYKRFVLPLFVDIRNV